MNNVRVIGLYGDIGSGKDSVANFLCAAGAHRRAFADNLRLELMVAYPDPYAHQLILTADREKKEQPSILLSAGRVEKDMPDFAEIVAYQAYLKYGRGSWLSDKQIPVSPRDVLRWYGTQYRRHLFGEDYWLAELERWVDTRGYPIDILVVPDVRTQIEFDWVCDNGILVEVVRPGNPYAGAMSNHSSDTPKPRDGQVSVVLSNDSTLPALGLATMVCFCDKM